MGEAMTRRMLLPLFGLTSATDQTIANVASDLVSTDAGRQDGRPRTVARRRSVGGRRSRPTPLFAAFTGPLYLEIVLPQRPAIPPPPQVSWPVQSPH
jgi:hypothetical protein